MNHVSGLIWYRNHHTGKWACFHRRVPQTYINNQIRLEWAEEMMRGDYKKRALWPKRRDVAASMVWC